MKRAIFYCIGTMWPISALLELVVVFFLLSFSFPHCSDRSKQEGQNFPRLRSPNNGIESTPLS